MLHARYIYSQIFKSVLWGTWNQICLIFKNIFLNTNINNQFLTFPFHKEQMTNTEIASEPKAYRGKCQSNETTGGMTVLHLVRSLPPSCAFGMYTLFCVYATLLTKKENFLPIQQKWIPQRGKETCYDQGQNLQQFITKHITKQVSKPALHLASKSSDL